MEKPITVEHEDFKTKLADLINSSKMPAFIMRYILQDFHSQLEAFETSQLRDDLRAYNEEQAKIKHTSKPAKGEKSNE